MREEEHINDMFEPDRSQLLSAVVKKTYVLTKEISKTWMEYPTLSTENKMGYLPVPKHQTHSEMRYDPSHGPQTAISSNILQSLKRPCYHHSERAKLCQEGMIIREHSKTNVRSKLRPDGAVIKEQSWLLDKPCSHHSKRATLCQEGIVIQERSKTNVQSKLSPDSTVIREWSQPLNMPCTHHSKRATPCQEGMVTQECLKANINVVKNIYLSTKTVSK